MENIFCPTCHKPAAQIIRTEEKVVLRQNGRTIISLSAQSKGNNIGVRCPDGHNVKVAL